jgi:hypothetical protein
MPGASGLVAKGYSGITETFELGKHQRGVFKNAAPLSAEVKEALDNAARIGDQVRCLF